MSNQERVAERRKHWGELIARQQQSGKTVKAFCEENGVGGVVLCMAEAAEGEDPASGLCLGGDRHGGPAARSGDGVDPVFRRAPSDRLAGTTTGAVIERVFSSNEGLGSGLHGEVCSKAQRGAYGGH